MAESTLNRALRPVTASEEQSLSADFAQAAPRVGFDRVDQAPLKALPDCVAAALGETLTASVTALATETSEPRALKRLLARDLVISRASLRTAQTMRNLALDEFFRGKSDGRRLAMLERLVGAEHRRMLATADALARLACGSATVKISSVNTAVVVRGKP